MENAKRVRKCPSCKGKNVKEILYGMPSADEIDSENPEVALGGCIVDPDSPKYRCAECSHEWSFYLSVREREIMQRGEF
jgi:hypothetical protein